MVREAHCSIRGLELNRTMLRRTVPLPHPLRPNRPAIRHADNRSALATLPASSPAHTIHLPDNLSTSSRFGPILRTAPSPSIPLAILAPPLPATRPSRWPPLTNLRRLPPSPASPETVDVHGQIRSRGKGRRRNTGSSVPPHSNTARPWSTRLAAS